MSTPESQAPPREYHYADFHEGQQFVSTYDITEERMADIVRILDYRVPLVVDDAGARALGFDSAVLPPAFAAAYQFVAAVPGVVLPPGGIYAKQELRMQGPAYVGDRLTTTTTVHAKYEKRGRRYIAFDSQTVRDDGSPVIWGRRTRIWPS
jgi:acyl dehydratase